MIRLARAGGAPHSTWDAALEHATRQWPAATAFCFDGPGWSTRLSFAEWRAACDTVAAGLGAFGVAPGDRVAVASTGSPVWPVLQTACSRVGAILVPINVRYRRDELRVVVQRSRPRIMFVQDRVHTTALLELVIEVCAELVADAQGGPARGVAPILVSLPGPDLPMPTGDTSAASGPPPATDGPGGAQPAAEKGGPSWAQFLVRASTAAVPDAVGEPDDPVLVQFTSGTTAFPKGALLSSAATLGTAFHLAERMGLSSADTLFSTQPFYHVGGTVATTLIALTHGCTAVVPERYEPSEVFRLVPAYGCTARSGQAAMYTMELAHPQFSTETFAGVTKGWAIGSPELLRAIRDRMGIRGIVQLYGLTEAAGISTTGSLRDDPETRIATAGRPYPGVEMGVATADGVRPAPRDTGETGETGEICIRGWPLMGGYLDDPDASAAAIDDQGWLHTGDVGRFDADGNLHFVDRLKDMIKPGGENVSAAEVERVIAGLDGVDRVAVIGVPDDRLGEAPLAVVELRPGSGLDQSVVSEHCRGMLASFKVPRRVVVTDDWPLTDSGKVQKNVLRDRYSRPGHGLVGQSG